MTGSTPPPWVCAQIGSREHYAIPRVLHADGRLHALLTDYWSHGRNGAAARIGSATAAKVAQRFHPALAHARVEHPGMRRMAFDLFARLRRRGTWPTVLARNAWFQRQMLRRLRHLESELRARPGIFFSYSYAALELARFFRNLGWKTILGQIDPGIREQEIVAAEHTRNAGIASLWQPAPDEYWRLWREECALCDCLMVNSPWSRDALIAAGISAGKIRVVPLAYEAPARDAAPGKSYPARFTPERPLRVLFLGQINLRKGAHLALAAAQMLGDAPVEWRFVGPAEIALPNDLAAGPRMKWSGPVARSTAAAIYAQADVFLLPTLSDGFALTQLEAQAAALPVLASRFCGAVVRDGVNGWLIDPLDAAQIATVVQRCLDDPERLQTMSAASGVGPEFSLPTLHANLLALERELLGD